MAKLDLLLAAWDEAHWELSLAFEGLADEDLWKRAHPKLLSVGEVAGHVAYWQWVKFVEPFGDTSRRRGGLADPAFKYFTEQVDNPVKLEIGVAELAKEVAGIHDEARAAVVKLDPAKDDAYPADSKATWGDYVQYQIFHVAYHTGQIYSVRHILGHETVDN